MNNLYDTLNEMQRLALLHKEGPLLILAGAGSGKTRVLTHRIAYLIEEHGVNPYQIMAITFTNKAAKEMRERVNTIVGYGAENIWVSTFHSSCVRILRRFIETIGYDRNFTIYDTDDQRTLMKEVCKYLNIDTKQIKERSILSTISSAKDDLISPEEFRQKAMGDFYKSKVADAYLEYQKRLKSNNALDFDDLINQTIFLFRNNPEALQYYQKRFRYILVDEYQDTNTAQFQLIKLLASFMKEDGEITHNLCVVGDDDQSIYKFRGANIRNILDFEQEYPDAKVIKLEQNYRSTKTILNAANEVIRNNQSRKEKALWTEKEEGEPIRFLPFGSDYEEAMFVAEEISHHVERGNTHYQDYAILYRTNAQSRSFEEKFIVKGIPYRLVGGINFYQRKEIKDILAYLRTIDNGQDNLALKRIINVPRRGIGLATIDRVEEFALSKDISLFEALSQIGMIKGCGRAEEKVRSFVNMISYLRDSLHRHELSLKALIDEILEVSGYLAELELSEEENAEERIANLDELKNKMLFYEENAEEAPTLNGFLAEISLVADIDQIDASTDVVTLMTLHSAKGLEFPHVYMGGMEENLFPSFMVLNAENPEEELEEERRLCYVGITRAKSTLTLTASAKRMTHGEIRYNAVSRFIREIPRYLLSHAPAPSPSLRVETEIIKKKSTIPYFSTPAKNIGSGPLTNLDYTTGDMVFHVKFGNGVVKDIIKGGKDFEVTVEFPAGTKKMLASFAKLKKV